MSQRTEKIASIIQHELATLLLKYFESDKFGLITIVNVDVYDDLSEAKIYLSVQKNVKRFFEKISKKAWKISKELSPRLIAKKTPKLVFLSDEKLKDTNKLLDLIDSL